VEVVPIDINERVVALLDDFEASKHSPNDALSDPAPQASNDEIAITTVDLTSDFPTLSDPTTKAESPLDVLSLIPSAPETPNQEILPETLSAGVHELYKPSSEPSPENMQVVEVPAVREINDLPAVPSLALNEALPSKFSPVNNDHFAATREIVVIDELLGLPAMRAEKPKTVTDKPANFENTTEIFLATLESINDENASNHFDENALDEESPVAAHQADSVKEVDGWLAEEFSREEIVEPEFLLKTDERLLDELRKMPANPMQTVDLNGVTAAGTNNIKNEVSPIRVESPSLDEIFLEVNADSVDLQKDTAITENNSTTGATLDGLSLALPDFPELSNIETPIAEPPATIPPALADAAPEAQSEEPPPAQSVSTAHDTNLLLHNEARTPSSEASETLAKNGSGWTTLRERAAGWIKRAFAKLMTMVGKRSA
jgi:hypothetical protein